MSKFSDPAEKLGLEVREYARAQADQLKFQTVKALSQGTATLTGLLLIFIVGSALLLTLSFALVLLIGELMKSYAMAAFIVSGALALILIILIAIRPKLFKNSFIPNFLQIFFPERPVEEGDDNLDVAMLKNQVRIHQQESNVLLRWMQAKSFYTPSRLAEEGLRKVSGKAGISLSADGFLPSVLQFFLRLLGKRK